MRYVTIPATTASRLIMPDGVESFEIGEIVLGRTISNRL